MQKIGYLDGLRGLAALIVVFSHYVYGYYPTLQTGKPNVLHSFNNAEVFISGTPLNIFYSGDFSVCVFFILSGYVLSYKYFKCKDHKIIEASAVKRYFRLALPVLFSIVIAYIFMKFSLFCNQEAGRITGSTYWLSKFYSFAPSGREAIKQALFGVFFHNESSYNKVLWTMSYELYGSFLVFGIASLFGTIKNRYCIYTAIILLLINTYFFAFVLGLFLSDLSNNKQNYFIKFENKLLIAFLLAVGLFLGSYPSSRDVSGTMYAFMEVGFLKDPGTFYHILGAFFVLVALLISDTLKSIFSSKTLLFLGKISFSMYAIHLILLCSFSSFVFTRLALFMSYNVACLITFAISVVLIMIISYYIYKYVDLNSIRLSQYIYNYFFKDKNNYIKNDLGIIKK